MALEVDGAIMATARFSQYADGNGAAITALTLAERLATSYGDDDPHVQSRREELFL